MSLYFIEIISIGITAVSPYSKESAWKLFAFFQDQSAKTLKFGKYSPWIAPSKHLRCGISAFECFRDTLFIKHNDITSLEQKLRYSLQVRSLIIQKQKLFCNKYPLLKCNTLQWNYIRASSSKKLFIPNLSGSYQLCARPIY